MAYEVEDVAADDVVVVEAAVFPVFAVLVALVAPFEGSTNGDVVDGATSTGLYWTVSESVLECMSFERDAREEVAVEPVPVVVAVVSAGDTGGESGSSRLLP